MALPAGRPRQVPLEQGRAAIRTAAGAGAPGRCAGAGQGPPALTVPVLGQRLVEDGGLGPEEVLGAARGWGGGRIGLVHGVAPLLPALEAQGLAGALLHSPGTPRGCRRAAQGAQWGGGLAGLLEEPPPL